MKNIKQRHIFTFITSLLIIVLLNYIVSFIHFRLDLTSENRYTLKPATEQILETLEDAVYIKIYLEGDGLPVKFRKLQRAIKELLNEFEVIAGEPFYFEFINPDEDYDKKARRALYNQLSSKGLSPVELKEKSEGGKMSRKIIFPGAVIVHQGREIAINLLKNNQAASAEVNINNSIQALEYEFINAIKKLATEKRQRIAFTEGHDELMDPWVGDIMSQLSEYYQVERALLNDTTPLSHDFSLLIIAKPKKMFTEKEKYKLDQYIMHGGNVLWMVEGVKASMDSLREQPQFIAMPNDLNLSDQLFRYGARINPALVEDWQCAPVGVARPGPDGRPNIKLFPWQFFPLLLTQNNHPVNKYLNFIRTEFISPVDTVGSSTEVKKTVLLQTSKNSKIRTTPSPVSLSLIREFNEADFSGSPKNIAVLLEGTFNSVFKNRMIHDFTESPDDFREKSALAKMIIIGDGDMIKNEVSAEGEIYPLGFDRHSQKTYPGNAEFFVNAVNYLCDDAGLMSVRARELKIRLLDKEKIRNQQITWQVINTIAPVLIVIIAGVIITFLRRKKYAK